MLLPAHIHHCEPRKPQPCIQYRESAKQELNEFLLLYGGQEAQFDADGTAHIVSQVKGDTRTCFAKPGAWVRCLDRGQFSSVSARYFEELYRLVRKRAATSTEGSADN